MNIRTLCKRVFDGLSSVFGFIIIFCYLPFFWRPSRFEAWFDNKLARSFPALIRAYIFWAIPTLGAFAWVYWTVPEAEWLEHFQVIGKYYLLAPWFNLVAPMAASVVILLALTVCLLGSIGYGIYSIAMLFVPAHWAPYVGVSIFIAFVVGFRILENPRYEGTSKGIGQGIVLTLFLAVMLVAGLIGILAFCMPD